MRLRYKLLISGVALGLAALFSYVRSSGDEEPKNPAKASEKAPDDKKDSLEGKLTIPNIPKPRPFYNDQAKLGSDYDGDKADQDTDYDNNPKQNPNNNSSKPKNNSKTNNDNTNENELAENAFGLAPNGLEENLKAFEDLRVDYYSGVGNFARNSPEKADALVSLYLEAGDYQRAINLLSTMGDYESAFAVAKEYLESGTNNKDATTELCSVGLLYLTGICNREEIQPPEDILEIVVGACETRSPQFDNYKAHLKTVCPALVDKEALTACHTALDEVDGICGEDELPSEELTAYTLKVCFSVGKYITLLERDNLCTRL